MIRRWIIRSLALTLLTFCVLSWVGSYWRGLHVTYRDMAEIQLEEGRMGILLVDSTPIVDHGLVVLLRPCTPFDWEYWDNKTDCRFMGFSIIPWLFVSFPLNFPTLLTTLLLWFVWRKTRAKPRGGAFPVEPAKSGEKQP